MIDIQYTDELPQTIKGLTVQLSVGEYLVLINRSLTEAEQHKTLTHELLHIKCGHFADHRSVAEIERETHEQTRRLFAF